MGEPSQAVLDRAALKASFERVDATYDTFVDRHRELVRRGRGSDNALTAAQELRNTTDELRSKIFKIENSNDVEGFLREEEGLFPLAYELSTLIAHPKIQCFDALKREMSQSVDSLMRIAVFQCSAQKRRIYLETADEIKKSLRQVIMTFPAKECEAEFKLKCAHAAAKKLDVDKGKWRNIGSVAAAEFGQATLEVLLSPSAVPPFISLAPFAAPIMHLVGAIWEAREEAWYQAICNMEFEAERGGFRVPGHFSAIKAQIIRNEDNYKFHFYLTTLFDRMIHDDEIDNPDFKRDLIFADDLSLKTLASRNVSIWNSIKRKNQGKFWRVRYHALECLAQAPSGLRRGITQLIAERVWAKGERNEVQELARSLLARRVKEQQVVQVAASSSPSHVLPAPEEHEVQLVLSQAEGMLGQQGVDLSRRRRHKRVRSSEEIEARIRRIDRERARLVRKLDPESVLRRVQEKMAGPEEGFNIRPECVGLPASSSEQVAGWEVIAEQLNKLDVRRSDILRSSPELEALSKTQNELLFRRADLAERGVTSIEVIEEKIRMIDAQIAQYRSDLSQLDLTALEAEDRSAELSTAIDNRIARKAQIQSLMEEFQQLSQMEREFEKQIQENLTASVRDLFSELLKIDEDRASCQQKLSEERVLQSMGVVSSSSSRVPESVGDVQTEKLSTEDIEAVAFHEDFEELSRKQKALEAFKVALASGKEEDWDFFARL